MESLSFANQLLCNVQAEAITADKKFLLLTAEIHTFSQEEKELKSFKRDLKDYTDFKGNLNLDCILGVNKHANSRKAWVSLAFYYEAIGDNRRALEYYLKLIQLRGNIQPYLEKCQGLIANHWDFLEFLEQVPVSNLKPTEELSNKLLRCQGIVNEVFKKFLGNLKMSMPASVIFIGGDEKHSSITEKLIFKLSDDLKILPLALKSSAFRSYYEDSKSIYNDIPKCEKVILLCTPAFKSQCDSDITSGPHLQLRLINHHHKVNSIFALVIEGSAAEALPQDLHVQSENIGTNHNGYYQSLLWLVAKIHGCDVEELNNSFIKEVQTHLPEMALLKA